MRTTVFALVAAVVVPWTVACAAPTGDDAAGRAAPDGETDRGEAVDAVPAPPPGRVPTASPRESADDAHVLLMAKLDSPQPIRRTLALDAPVGRYGGDDWSLADILVTASFEPPVYVQWEVAGPAELIASYVADLRERYDRDERMYDFAARREPVTFEPDPNLTRSAGASITARVASVRQAADIVDWNAGAETEARLRAVQWDAEALEATWIVEGSERAVQTYVDNLRRRPGLRVRGSEVFAVTHEPVGC